jgi:hypothetical protein
MLRATTVTFAVVVVLTLTVLTGFVIRVSRNKVEEKAVMESRPKEEQESFTLRFLRGIGKFLDSQSKTKDDKKVVMEKKKLDSLRQAPLQMDWVVMVACGFVLSLVTKE